jgi:hypothetical protein
MNMKVKSIAVVVLALLLLAGCAPGPNASLNTVDAAGKVPGFWQGLWNGVISPVTFVISLFNPKVNIYEIHNNGGWYNLGFLFGMSVIFGGSAGGAASRRRHG